MKKPRLDQLLVSRNLAESREAAQRMIMAGEVRVNGHPAIKSSQSVAEDAPIDVAAPPRFVSRGGEKLLGALESFDLNPAGAVCLDVGASTGGFTDCLLQHGADFVYAVDVGRGQMAWRLRQDERVACMEKVNARRLDPEAFERPISWVTVDVSFISLTLILAAVRNVIEPNSTLVTLVKPQFEAGRDQVGKGGVVRDPAVHDEVLDRVRTFGVELGLGYQETCTSPLKGPAGNVEFFIHWVTT